MLFPFLVLQLGRSFEHSFILWTQTKVLSFPVLISPSNSDYSLSEACTTNFILSPWGLWSFLFHFPILFASSNSNYGLIHQYAMARWEFLSLTYSWLFLVLVITIDYILFFQHTVSEIFFSDLSIHVWSCVWNRYHEKCFLELHTVVVVDAGLCQITTPRSRADSVHFLFSSAETNSSACLLSSTFLQTFSCLRQEKITIVLWSPLSAFRL